MVTGNKPAEQNIKMIGKNMKKDRKNTANTERGTKKSLKRIGNCGFRKRVSLTGFQSLCLSFVTFDIMLETRICLTRNCDFVVDRGEASFWTSCGLD